MTTLHKEIHFESEICEHLAAHGWLYTEGDAAGYDRARALFPADLVAWVQVSQQAAWATLVKNHGANAETVLLDRVRKTLDERSTLEVLRIGVDIVGLKQSVELAKFKPALEMNPDLVAKYNANRLRVVRQVRYSTKNEKSIDFVLFLNGLPVATCEVKSEFTQSVGDAVDQYRFDRLPREGGATEPLLAFPSGAIVHFAVSNMEAWMTTRLEGPATTFIPFNRGDEGAAGNPPNPNGGNRTAYMWEEVWQRDSWLEILGRYVMPKKNDKTKKLVGFTFPRYHQLDVTRKLRATVLAEGPGGKYLIQHSAGSGKTNSIAWTAHFLADLHDADHQKLFAKLDGAGLYDDYEVDRVVAVELDPKAKQKDLAAALEPVVDRILKRYGAAKKSKAAAEAIGNEEAAKAAKDDMDVLILAKQDMGAFLRLYAFLSQMIDYGNTAVEQRFIFYKRLLPLLEFGRERETIDLSKVVLTHHHIRNKGNQALPLGVGDSPTIAPLTETGGGSVQEKQKALLTEIIAKLNAVFEGDLTDGDQLSYFTTLKGKVMESPVLQEQALNNTREQFSNSPDLSNVLLTAIMDALSAHTAMSTQALADAKVQTRLRDLLLAQGQLWEDLRVVGGKGDGAAGDNELPQPNQPGRAGGPVRVLGFGDRGLVAAEEGPDWPDGRRA